MEHMEVSWNRGTPKNHPNFHGSFPNKNHPFFGVPPFMEPPKIKRDIQPPPHGAMAGDPSNTACRCWFSNQKYKVNPPNNTGSLVGSWTTTTNNQWRISNINSWGLALWLIEAQWLDVRAQCHQEWVCNLRIPRPQVHPGISHHIIRFFSVWIPIFHSYLGYLHRASRHLRKASPNISHDLRQFILLHSPIISHVFIVFRSLWCFITPYTFHYFSLVRMVLSWYYHGISWYIMVYCGILWYITMFFIASLSISQPDPRRIPQAPPSELDPWSPLRRESGWAPRSWRTEVVGYIWLAPFYVQKNIYI